MIKKDDTSIDDGHPHQKLTDKEFIALWRSTGGAAELSRVLGLNLAGIFKRRRRIEARYGIILDGSGNAPRTIGETRTYIDVRNGSVVNFSDCHYWPGLVSLAHQALCILVKEMRAEVKVLLANGDIFDGATCSRHDPLHWQVVPQVFDELKAVQDRLSEIQRAAPNAKRLHTVGNHDSRFDRFLANNVPEFAGVKGMSLADHIPEWPISYSVMVNDGVPGGATMYKHAFKGGIHAPRNNALSAGISIVTGHLHSQKQTPITDYLGTRYGVDAGMLASPFAPSFAYTLDNPCDWRSGFAYLTYDNKGRLLPPELCELQHWRTKRGVHGRAVFRGKVIIEGEEHPTDWQPKMP
jgi:hypothetical protein